MKLDEILKLDKEPPFFRQRARAVPGRKNIQKHAVVHVFGRSSHIVDDIPDNIAKSMERIKENVDDTGRGESSPFRYHQGNKPKPHVKAMCLKKDFKIVYDHYKKKLPRKSSKDVRYATFRDLGIFTHYTDKHLIGLYKIYQIIDPALIKKVEFFRQTPGKKYISMTLLKRIANFKKRFIVNYVINGKRSPKTEKLSLDYIEQRQVIAAYMKFKDMTTYHIHKWMVGCFDLRKSPDEAYEFAMAYERV